MTTSHNENSEFCEKRDIESVINAKELILKFCPVRTECKKAKTVRLIYRSENAQYYEANRINFEEKEHLYKTSQVIVVHHNKTLKRSRKTSGEVQLHTYEEGNEPGGLRCRIIVY